jgi:hypothetical protein
MKGTNMGDMIFGDSGGDEARNRIRFLEQENHRLKTFGLVGLGTALLSFLFVEGQILSVSRQQLTNSPRADIERQPKFWAKEIESQKLVITNRRGEPSIIFGQGGDDGMQVLFADRGKTRLALTTAADGTPAIVMSDPRGIVRLDMAVSLEGNPSLNLRDMNSKEVITLHTSPSLGSVVRLNDYSKGRGGVSLSGGELPCVMVVDENKKPRFVVGMHASYPAMSFFGKDGEKRIVIAESELGAHLGALASDGSAVAIAAGSTLDPLVMVKDRAGHEKALSVNPR